MSAIIIPVSFYPQQLGGYFVRLSAGHTSFLPRDEGRFLVGIKGPIGRSSDLVIYLEVPKPIPEIEGVRWLGDFWGSSEANRGLRIYIKKFLSESLELYSGRGLGVFNDVENTLTIPLSQVVPNGNDKDDES
jgi:hypothetical protein